MVLYLVYFLSSVYVLCGDFLNVLTQVTRMTSAAEMAAVAKQAEDYICSSIKLAYDRVYFPSP